MISLERFQHLTRDFNVIPLVRTRIADVETPITLAARLQDRGKYFLLESVEGGETWGRFSILGFDIRKQFVIENGQAILRQDDVDTVLPGNPVDALQHYLAHFEAVQVPHLPRFFGGVVGFFSFEAVQYFERCGTTKPGNGRFADAEFLITDKLFVFDNVEHTIHLVCCIHPGDYESVDAAYQSGIDQLDEMVEILESPVPRPVKPTGKKGPLEMHTNMSRDDYEQMVSSAKRYIRNGDIIQVVLAQHFSTEITASPLDVYRALRHINPSPYMYMLQLDGDRAIAGSSPEVMVRVTDNVAETRPIAGTRRRGESPAEDQALADELLADPKERAEHVMLVDLARNDLGRIAQVGSVNVTDFMIIERYSHVMHIVSHVKATLRDDCSAIDVFKATFPAGTLSGAPKVRAMEIINEQEPTRRGPYGGALGYIGYGGNIMDMAITIRTVVLDGKHASVTAGAGIVFDSVPANEYEETRQKSRGMRRALNLAERGLSLEEEPA